MSLYMMLRRKSIKYSLVFHFLPQKCAEICMIKVLENFLSGSSVAVFVVVEFLYVGVL